MFVCKKNSRRSQMAEGFAKILGQEKLLVTSSGLEASEVDPLVVEVMAEVGIDIRSQRSQPLSQFNAQEYDIVISLCGCGVNLPTEWLVQERFEDWQIDDPEGQTIETFRRVREEVRSQVIQLIDSLALYNCSEGLEKS
jgi:glutathione/glutaredoxin type arsenate reductase